MRLARLALVAALVALVSAFALPSAAPSLHTITLAPGDTFRIVAAWPAVADGQGPADSYTVTWTTQRYALVPQPFTTLPVRTVPGTADTLIVAMPPYSDSLRVSVAVAAKRGTHTSATSATAVKFFRRPNPVPPAPTTVTLDTTGT